MKTRGSPGSGSDSSSGPSVTSFAMSLADAEQAAEEHAEREEALVVAVQIMADELKALRTMLQQVVDAYAMRPDSAEHEGGNG